MFDRLFSQIYFQVVSEPCKLKVINLYTTTKEQFTQYDTVFRLRMNRCCVVTSLSVYFDILFTKCHVPITISMAPHAPKMAPHASTMAPHAPRMAQRAPRMARHAPRKAPHASGTLWWSTGFLLPSQLNVNEKDELYGVFRVTSNATQHKSAEYVFKFFMRQSRSLFDETRKYKLSLV